MSQIIARGENVYQCDTCQRRIRTPTNRLGMDVIQRCIITSNCQGKLHRVTTIRDINNTPSIPVEQPGIEDWVQRKVLATHTQRVQSTTWIVKHDLGTNPVVFVYVDRSVSADVTDLVEVTSPSIIVINSNEIHVEFDVAEKGLVQCVALASKNTANPPISHVVASKDIQLTNKGELTIATLNSDQTITVPLEYLNPNSASSSHIDYLNVGTPSILSAWTNVDRIFLNGRQYTTRSFNIIATPMAPSFFQTGQIVNGSTVKSVVTDVNQMVVLLSSAPHQSADRIVNTYVDLSTISNLMYYANGELFIKAAAVRSTYPPIMLQ